MRILIKVRRSPEKRYLVSLLNEELINDINKLIHKGKHRKAIDEALSRGNLKQEISEEEAMRANVRLILTEKNAHYDLM